MKIWPHRKPAALLWAWSVVGLILTVGLQAQAQEFVAGAALGSMPVTGQRVEIAGPVSLTAYWFAVPSDHRLPTVVTLHGCNGPYDQRGGLNSLQRRYARDLNNAGYHVLVLDSFGSRGVQEICSRKMGRRPVTLADRRNDVGAALVWLAARPEVDAQRLVLLGWSNGAQTVLAALDASDIEVRERPVHPRAAVALYPGCVQPQRNFNYRLQAPLLMLLGELDDWTPIASCVALHQRLSSQPPRFDQVIYPGSYHAFDIDGPVRVRGNVGSTASGTATLGGTPEARADAWARTLKFLEETLR